MTLLIWFYQSQYRTFKDFYQQQVCRHLGGAFPRLVSYGRFVVALTPGNVDDRKPFWLNLGMPTIQPSHQRDVELRGSRW